MSWNISLSIVTGYRLHVCDSIPLAVRAERTLRHQTGTRAHPMGTVLFAGVKASRV